MYILVSGKDILKGRNVIEIYHDLEDYGDCDTYLIFFVAEIPDDVELDTPVQELILYGVLMNRDCPEGWARVRFITNDCNKCKFTCEKRGKTPSYRDLIEGKITLAKCMELICFSDDLEKNELTDLDSLITIKVKRKTN